MKGVLTGLAAMILAAGIASADSTDVSSEMKAKAVEAQTKVEGISAGNKVKADSLKATAKAKVAAKKTGTEKWVTSTTGLKTMDTKIGTGAQAKTGMTVSMHYTGWLWENGAKGKKFDSSRDRNQPYPVPLGAGRVIKGWDEGIVGMKEGGQRTLIIPPDLAYGAGGFPGAIPPNATLMFELELVKIVK